MAVEMAAPMAGSKADEMAGHWADESADMMDR